MAFHRVLRITSYLLILVMTSNSAAFAAGNPPDASAIRSQLYDHGVGKRVQVKLNDKTRVKGILVSIDSQNFALKVNGSDKPRVIAYDQIASVNRARVHTGLSTGARVGILVGIGAAIVFLTVEFVKAWDGALRHV